MGGHGLSNLVGQSVTGGLSQSEAGPRSEAAADVHTRSPEPPRVSTRGCLCLSRREPSWGPRWAGRG